MKRISTFFIILTLSLSLFFTSIGYASITQNLSLYGTATAGIPNEIFISGVTPTTPQDKSTLISNAR